MSASEWEADLLGGGSNLATRAPLVLVKPYEAPIAPARLHVKRVLDVVFACLGLVIALPLAAAIALAVKVSSPGPVFYRQARVGRDGRLFVMVKFRTMRDGTHREILDDPEALRHFVANDFKLSPEDPRITAVGRVLRKTSVDELPQLLNVLAGHMSLVGIRPIEAAQLALRQPADRTTYMLLRPGLTGLWQINGRSTMDPADRITLDNRYVENWSLRRDFAIMLRTPAAILNLRHTH